MSAFVRRVARTIPRSGETDPCGAAMHASLLLLFASSIECRLIAQHTRVAQRKGGEPSKLTLGLALGFRGLNVDDRGTPGFTKNEQRRFAELLEAGGLVDAWRMKHPLPRAVNMMQPWWTWRGTGCGTTLVLILGGSN
jgi:hypothetical protein